MSGQLKKQARAQRTKNYNNQLKAITPAKGTIPYNYIEHESQFITQTKIDILNLPYKYVAWLGAKDGGKTRPVVTRLTGMVAYDKSIYGLALKKYKTNAAARLHTAVSNMAREMRMAGYDIPLVQKGLSNSSFLRDVKFRDNNQTIEYAALDDMDGIAGIEAPNLGQFGIVHIEEPVMKGDKEQPSPEDFWETIRVLESSVNRSNRRYAELNKTEIMFPTYHFTMNAWDDHPIVVEAEQVFPENDFLNFCLGIDNWETTSVEYLDENWEAIKKSLQENHTKAVAVKKDGKAFVRMTLFANPMWPSSEIVYNPKLEASKEEQIENFWNMIKGAIINKDYSLLAIFLGMKKQKSNENKTYQTSLLQTSDTVKQIKEEGWKIFGTSQGWDVDINRLFVDTPVVLAHKYSIYTGWEYKLFVLPQKEFLAGGDGGGRNIPIYKNNMVAITEETHNEFIKLTGNSKFELGSYLYIDDNQGQWLQYFLDDPIHMKGKAQKHGLWDIISRQNWLNQAINSGFIVIDEKNTKLIDEIKRSTLAQSSDKRDESGGLNKYYDRLNSMEYSVYPFSHWINEYIRSK